MSLKISIFKKNSVKTIPEGKVIVTDNLKSLTDSILSKDEIQWIKRNINNKMYISFFNRLKEIIWVVFLETKKGNKEIEGYKLLEQCRDYGNQIVSECNKIKIESISANFSVKKEFAFAFCEGAMLGNYQFIKYYSDAENKKYSLKNFYVENVINENGIFELSTIYQSVKLARDLVNEPAAYMTAKKFSSEIQKIGKTCGLKVEVFNKQKIASLKMNGLLAVNQGSPNEPTFTVIEWKPANAKNKKPFIVIGKGVTFDSGGLNIKPGTAMDTMKCDMGGAAAVAGIMYALAMKKIPVHVVGLIPATDNRPDGNAYAPGDVVTMKNGKTVEVISTDAEGRMILADALCYASEYKPEFAIDMATLTGAASIAIGPLGMVGMTNTPTLLKKLTESGNIVYERIAEFPFWDEYGEEIKSKVADIKNVGNRFGGAITAGKFLEHFVDYPWIHLDIAGPVFLDSKDSYRGVGATGYGVRLLYHFFNNYKF